MFSGNLGPIDVLREQLGDAAVDAIVAVIGQCMTDLTHSGTLFLDGARPVGATDAVLHVRNGQVAPEDQYTVAPANGDAIWIEGGARIEGMLRGGLGWAKATDNWVDAGSDDAWESYVDCALASDAAGTAVPGLRTVRVYLNRTATQTPNVRTGDVIRFWTDLSGTSYAIEDMFDGKVGELRSIIDGDPADYAGGLRGWFIADGANGTTDAGGLTLQGYTGAGAWATVGGAITASITGTISGDGDAVPLNVVVDNHASHTHDTSILSIAGGLTSHDYNHKHYLYVSGDEGTATPGQVDMVYPGDDGTQPDYWVTSAPILSSTTTTNHTAGSPVYAQDSEPSAATTTLSHSGSGTATSGGPSATMTHTVSAATVESNDIAAQLSYSASAIRPAGVVVLFIQRVN